jgi:hypothetical protein
MEWDVGGVHWEKGWGIEDRKRKRIEGKRRGKIFRAPVTRTENGRRIGER